MAKNIEMSVLGSDGSYEVLYPTSVSDNILLSQEMLNNLGLESGTLDTAIINIVMPSTVPVGSIFWYGNENPPIGFLKCDGSNINRITYAQLFAVIGVVFGSGDGSTTFRLPNLLGKFIRGSGTSDGYSATFGQIQQASRIYNSYGHAGGNYGYTGAESFDKQGTTSAILFNLARYSATTPSFYLRPVNIALTPIIKY